LVPVHDFVRPYIVLNLRDAGLQSVPFVLAERIALKLIGVIWRTVDLKEMSGSLRHIFTLPVFKNSLNGLMILHELN
jgi:hypothetical protein